MYYTIVCLKALQEVTAQWLCSRSGKAKRLIHMNFRTIDTSGVVWILINLDGLPFHFGVG